MNGTRVNAGLAASAFGLLLGLAACASDTVTPPPQPAQPEAAEKDLPPEIRVGLLLPLSGPAEGLAQDMLEAAEMALFDVGANDLVLLPRDTRGTPTGARQAAEQVIEEGAEVILGPLFSQGVQAVSPVAAQAGIRVLAFSNDASVATDGTFLLGFRPDEQVRRVVEYALASGALARVPDATAPGLGAPVGASDETAPETGALPETTFAPGRATLAARIAGLAPNDAYGETTLAALREAVIQGGGEMGPTEYYPPNLADPSEAVRRIAAYDRRAAALEAERQRLAQSAEPGTEGALARLETLDTLGGPPFEGILLADGGNRLRSVAALLTFFDVDPASTRFLGTMRWQDDPRVLAEVALQRGWFAAPSPDNQAAFEVRFQSAFGRPPHQLAALAYDATALAVVVTRNLQDRKFDPQNLTNAQGFSGATGLFRLLPDGLAEHGLAVLEVSGGATRIIDPPPASFEEVAAF